MRNKVQIWISMFSYSENWKATYFAVFYLNLSIEAKIKTLFLISYFNSSKKRNGTESFVSETKHLYFHLYLISIRHWKLVSYYNIKFYIVLRYRYNIMMLETMSLYCQYVISLHHDKNPTKSRCCHNIVCSQRSRHKTFLRHLFYVFFKTLGHGM